MKRVRDAGLIVAALVCASATISSTQRPTPSGIPRDLTLNQPIDGEIAGGEAYAFHLSITAGQFVDIVVEQHGIDLVAELSRPDGSMLHRAGYIIGESRPETIVIVADASGVFTLNVFAENRRAPRGAYRVVLKALRPPEPTDTIRIQAERTFEQARNVENAGPQTQYPKVIDDFKTSESLYRQAADRAGELKTLLARGNAEWIISRPEALQTGRTAEQLALQLNDDASRAAAIDVQAVVLERQGDMASALELEARSFEIYERLGDRNGQTGTLNELGIEYGRTGDSDRALARFERALALARELHSDPMTRMALNNIGIAYKNVGEYDKALDAYQQALVLSTPVKSDRANLLNNIGNVESLLGRDREALALHLQALDIAREAGSKEVEARSLNTIGQRYYALGNDAEALRYQTDALALRRTLGDLPGEAASLDALGHTLRRLGETDKAYASLTEALAIRQRIRDEYGEPNTLRNLALIERDRGDLDRALDRIKAAVDLDETLRERITSPELRATFVASELDKYETYIDILQQLNAKNPTGRYASEAFEVSERARARVLLESLIDARVDLREGIDPALLERERALQKQLSAASAQISRALAKPGQNEPPADLVKTYERLTSEYQQHLALVRQQSPRYAAMTQPQPLDVATIQRTVLDDDTVLLEFELGAERSWLWAVTPKTLASSELPPRADVDTAARALYETLTARQPRAGESRDAYAKRVATADAALDANAAALSRMLLGGIADRLRGEWRNKRLAIVSAGSLEYLPFSALPSPGAGPRTPLGAHHEIVKVPSASVLAVLRQEAAARPRAAHGLAVLADPVFDASDPRVTAAKPNAPALRAPDAEDIDESLYVRSGLARLPFSREEAKAIAAVAGPDAFTAIDFQASRATALGGALAGHRIVHLATHGVLDAARPSLSGLVLSLVDEHGQSRDGFIRLHDIYNMRLDADLVVLSACQTALGKDIKGEGLIGLTRAFMYAGTPRVVASLWEVNDLATSELMKRFYAAMLQRHLPAAGALRSAQLELANDPRWSSPYYWAGFVFQGDWK